MLLMWMQRARVTPTPVKIIDPADSLGEWLDRLNNPVTWALVVLVVILLLVWMYYNGRGGGGDDDTPGKGWSKGPKNEGR